MRVCRNHKNSFQVPCCPSGAGALLVALLVCGGSFGYAQEQPARPAAPGLRRVDPVEFQGRPEFQALLAGAAAAGERFAPRRAPANPFKTAGGKGLSSADLAGGKLAGAAGSRRKRGKSATKANPSIKNPYSKLRGAGGWALGGIKSRPPGPGDGGGAGQEEGAEAEKCAIGASGNLCQDWLVGETGCGRTVDGVLEEGDGLLGDGTFVDIWSLEVESTQLVDLALLSDEMDTFLFLVDADCFVIANNNDCFEGDTGSGSCLGAMLEPGTYHLVVNNWSPAEVGDYSLTVTCEPVNFCGDCVVGEAACGETIGGGLSDGDCALPDGSLFDTYAIEVTEPTRLTIGLRSAEVNPYLLVMDENCVAIGEIDDADAKGGDLDALLSLDLRPGNYFIIANSSGSGELGAYELSLACEPFDICSDCQIAELDCAGELVEDGLFEDDCVLQDGSFIDVFSLNLAEGGRLALSLNSIEFDSFLWLYNESCEVVDTNDDCQPGNFDRSCLTADVEAGLYFVAVNSYAAAETGLYQLTATCQPGFEFCVDCNVGSVACDDQVTGTLDLDDCQMAGDGSFIDLYTFELEEPGPVIIDLSSLEFDTFLRLYNQDCEEVAVDDDGGEELNSRMTIDLEACTYVLGINSYANGESGTYDISIRCPDVRLCRDCEAGSISCGDTVSGVLAAGDCALADGTLVDSYTFTVDQTSQVTITLRSNEFDTFVNISDNFCEAFLSNEDCSPGNFGVSCIEGVTLNAGTYTIGVSAAGAGELGVYALEVSCERADSCADCGDGVTECPAVLDGLLEASDCSLDNGRLFDSYELEVQETQEYIISLTSGNLDTFLYIYNGESCEEIAFDDDGGDGLNSQLALTLAPGTYWILPSSYAAGANGSYTMDINCNKAAPCPPCETGEAACGEPVDSAFPLDTCARVGGQSEDIYTVVVEGGVLDVSLASPEFDTYLTVYDSNCLALGVNDDCEPGNLALSCLTLEVAAGTYYIGVSSYAIGEQGNFSLNITCEGGEVVNNCADCVADVILPGESLAGDFPATTCTVPGGAEALDLWRLELEEPFVGSILLESEEFDTILGLLDRDCGPLSENDDCDQTTVNSCLQVDLDPGVYFLSVTSFEPGSAGTYNIALEVFEEPERSIGPFLRGDVDQSGDLQLTDAVAIFSYLFLGDSEPGCLAAADADGTGEINLTSGVFLLQFLFIGGQQPEAPFPQCARSSRAADLGLGCRRPPNCF